MAKLNVPIYINGNSESTTNRELYMEEDGPEKTLKCGHDGSGNIKVHFADQSISSYNLNSTKLDTTPPDDSVELSATLKPKQNSYPKIKNIPIDVNGTKITTTGDVILNSFVYGTQLPLSTVQGQIFFLIPQDS